MRGKIATTLGLGLALLGAVPLAHAQEGLDKVLGMYSIVKGEKDGSPIPEERIKGQIVRITADTITTVDKDNKEIYVAKYKLTPKSEGWEISMKATGGPGSVEGTEARGLLDLKGDNARLCYAYSPGGKVPTSFQTAQGAQQICFTLQRKRD